MVIGTDPKAIEPGDPWLMMWMEEGVGFFRIQSDICCNPRESCETGTTDMNLPIFGMLLITSWLSWAANITEDLFVWGSNGYGRILLDSGNRWSFPAMVMVFSG